MTFANRLKLLREEKNLTQQDVANALNVGRPTIAGYETKGKQPDFNKLIKLCELLDVSVDYLLGRSDIRNPYISNENNKINETKNTKKELEILHEKSTNHEKEPSDSDLATTQMVIDRLIEEGLLKDDKIDARVANMLLNSLKVDIELKLSKKKKDESS